IMLSLLALLMVVVAAKPSPAPTSPVEVPAQLALRLEQASPTFPRSTSVSFRLIVLNVDRAGRAGVHRPFRSRVVGVLAAHQVPPYAGAPRRRGEACASATRRVHARLRLPGTR